MTWADIASLIFIAAGTIGIVGVVWDAISLRQLTRAINVFIEHKKGSVFTLPQGMPISVRKLAASFARLIHEAEEVRTRDVEVSRLKSDFLTSTAHQLQTPLAQVRWAIEGLSKEQLSEDARNLVGEADRQSKAIAELINSYIEVANLESGLYAYQFQTADLSALVREVASQYLTEAEQAHIRLSLTLTEGAWPVRMDRARITQVLKTLLDNALQYTSRGGAVEVRLEPGSQQLVLIRVSDTGIGIPKNDGANIFEQFYRGDQARRAAPNGNGLALYMARIIARAHGGNLIFENNKVGAGTTFTLSLSQV